jgi:hypothetical protein
MKIFNRPNLTAICAAVLIFNFSSCKYEDGPSISLRTKKGRLTGEWEATYIAGQKVTNGQSFILEFEKDGDVTVETTYSYYGYTSTYSSKGEWEWEDNKKSLEITFDGDKEEWDITRLTNKEFEFEDSDNNKYEFEKN